MSLWWNRRRIARAVNGEAGATEEAALRQHLARCDACRAEYDRLTRAARHARGDVAPTSGELERDLARVLLAVDRVAPGPVVRQRRGRSVVVWAAVLAAALVAVVTSRSLRFGPAPDGGGVQYRGGPGEPSAPSELVRLYAKPKSGGAVHLVADFPAAGEARVPWGEWLQFKTTRDALVVTAEQAGQAPTPLSNGESVELAPGRWEIFAAPAGEGLAKRERIGVLWVDGEESRTTKALVK